MLDAYKDKERRRKYSRDWNAKRRKAHRAKLREIKLERGCEDCGYSDHAEALDFDHRDPTTKKFNIGQRAFDYAWETVLAEIAKCEVVCANCHRVRHIRAAS